MNVVLGHIYREYPYGVDEEEPFFCGGPFNVHNVHNMHKMYNIQNAQKYPLYVSDNMACFYVCLRKSIAYITLETLEKNILCVNLITVSF